jgi:cobalt-zinc-cadmium efflux system membrane fusion protein
MMKSTKKMKIFNIFVIMSISVFLFTCNRPESLPLEVLEPSSHERVTFSREQVKQARIEFGGFQDAELSHDVYAKGKLMLPNDKMAEVNTTIGGIVSKIFVHHGESVGKGQPLCRLVHPDIIKLQQAFLNAKYEFNLASEQYGRQQLLIDEDISSKKDFEMSECNYLIARVNLEALKMNARLAGLNMQDLEAGTIRDHIDICSPIGGNVNDILIHIGQYVEPGAALFDVVDKTDLYAELMVFEKDIPYIRIGQRVTMTLSNISEKVFEGEVFAVHSTMEETARTIPIIVNFNELPDNSYPGMFVASTIHTGEAICSAIPESAIVSESDGEHYIYYTMDDPENATEMHFMKVRVKPVLVEDGYASIEVLDSLPENAMIVVEGSYYIRSVFLRSLE